MPHAHLEFDVSAAIDDVWDFVREIGNWAAQMPGCQSFEVVSEDDSIWTAKVDIGPFSQIVTAHVHVTKWQRPDEVCFEFQGRSDPFRGSGCYKSEARDGRTHIRLDLSVEGSGPVASVLNALAGPALKKVGSQFADNLKRTIEAKLAPGLGREPPPAVEASTAIERVRAWVSMIARKIGARLRLARATR